MEIWKCAQLYNAKTVQVFLWTQKTNSIQPVCFVGRYTPSTAGGIHYLVSMNNVRRITFVLRKKMYFSSSSSSFRFFVSIRFHTAPRISYREIQTKTTCSFESQFHFKFLFEFFGGSSQLWKSNRFKDHRNFVFFFFSFPAGGRWWCWCWYVSST